jgi:hypothetical protein
MAVLLLTKNQDISRHRPDVAVRKPQDRHRGPGITQRGSDSPGVCNVRLNLRGAPPAGNLPETRAEGVHRLVVTTHALRLKDRFPARAQGRVFPPGPGPRDADETAAEKEGSANQESSRGLHASPPQVSHPNPPSPPFCKGGMGGIILTSDF